MNGNNFLKIFLAIIILALTACEVENERTPNIIVSNEDAITQTVYADQTSAIELKFETTGAWTSSTSVPWITVTLKSGDAAGEYIPSPSNSNVTIRTKNALLWYNSSAT